MSDLIFKKLFKEYKDGDQDPLRGSLLVTRLVEGSSSSQWIQSQLEDMADKIHRHEDIRIFLHHMQKFGFRGATDYGDKNLSSIKYVLRNKVGIPISLAIVIIGVGKLLGYRLQGINFPGHFLLKCNGSLIDPHGLKMINANTRAVLNERVFFINPKDLIQINGVKIVSRMLSNLKYIAMKEHDFGKAIEYCSYQILIEEVNFQLYVERASLFLNCGDKQRALGDLEKAILDAPSESVRDRLIVNRDKIVRRDSVIH